MIKKIIKSPFIFKNTYQYFTPLDKPIDSLTLQTIIDAHIQILKYAYQQFLFTPPFSVLFGSICIRAIYETTGFAVSNLKYKRYSQRKTSQIINKLFLVDLERDIKFYKIPQVKAYTMRQYYSPNQIFKYLINSYLILNYGRSLNSLINAKQNIQFMISSTSYNLLSYDPTFITPIIIMALNYILIRGSCHPFLINVTRKQNTILNINMGFMGGLLFVPLPMLYQLAYIGFIFAHIIIRSIKKYHMETQQKKIINKFTFKP